MGLPLGLLVGEFYYRADALPVPDTQPALQCQRTTSSPGNLWNNPPLIATEMIPSPVVSENIVEQHTKSHEESQ